MTNEEMTLPYRDGYTMPAEFSPHDGCIIVWPARPGSWGYGALAARKAFRDVIFAIAESEKVYVAAGKEHISSALDMLFDGKYAQKKEGFVYRDATHARKLQNLDALSAAASSADAEIAERDIRENIVVFEAETDDSWARDIAPTFLKHRRTGKVRAVNWKFNAWGGEYDGLYAHWEKDDAFAKFFAEKFGYPIYDASPFVLEGGSIHSDGEGTILVTDSCLMSAGRNPNLSQAEIEETLKRYLGAEKVLWLPRGVLGDETNEHVDNICAFIRPGEVVLGWANDYPQHPLCTADYHYLTSRTDAKERHIIVHKLPMPAHPVCVTKEDLDGYTFEAGEDVRTVGEELAASYVNFYFSNNALIVPAFGGDNEESDKQAQEILQKLCPERKVIPVNARDILLGGGNIHCITQQIPKRKKR
jgi:agmatine deiminase